MRQGVVFSIIVIVVFCSTVWAAAGDMGGGDGSEGNPYLIEDLDDFDTFADPNYATTYWASGVHTKLTTNIDLSGRTYTRALIAPDIDDTNGYFDGISFEGSFNGNNHTVINFNFSSENNTDIGLFGAISDATVTNLGITDVNIVANDYAGILTANAYNSEITGCYSSGQINLYYCGGGLVGFNYYSLIDNCYSTARINAEDTAGGLAGDNNYGTILNSYATGSVTTAAYGFAGGLVGENYGTIEGCYSTGNVVVPIGHGGGLIGYNTELVINCYAKGTVSGHRDCGGLVGENMSTITRCYSTGSITATGYQIGGLVGDNNRGTIQNCYSTGNVVGDDSVGGLVGLNDSGKVIYCYVAGKPTGTSIFGGLCGTVYPNGNYEHIGNFWDVENSGTTTAYTLRGGSYPNYTYTPFNGAVGIVEGKSTTQMKTESTFTGANWDFSDTDGDPADWMMLREGEDYPRLAGQEVFDGDIAGLYGVDLIDFAYLSQYWGLDDCNGVDDCGRADIDGSGDVGLSDLVEVANDWLQGI